MNEQTRQVLHSSKSDEWATPQALFDELQRVYKITLDVCATAENAKCSLYYTKEMDGLKQPWEPRSCFCNPPYSEIDLWLNKSIEDSARGARVIFLVPSRTDTNWFHRAFHAASKVIFIKGRLKFGESKNCAPFPSVLFVFDEWSANNRWPDDQQIFCWDWKNEALSES